MAASVLSVARTLGRLSAWTLSNLQTQKICYPAEMIQLGRTNGSSLIREDFEAWASGPTSPQLYEELKVFGMAPVLDVLRAPILNIDDAGYDALADAYRTMRDKSPGAMVRMTQGRHGAWARTFRLDAQRSVISKRRMLEEYRTRTDQAANGRAISMSKGPRDLDAVSPAVSRRDEQAR